MSVPVSQRIAGLTPVFHGSVSDAELASHGLARSEIIDFSVNANPLGPSPAAMAAAASAPWSRYPDDAATELRRTLARREDVDASEVVVGNGSAELLAPAAVCAALDAVRPPWSVNAVAQAAGLAALDDEAHLQRARDEVRRARGYLSAALAGRGLRVLPATANFLLVDVGNAAAVRSALLRHGLCVRDCTSFALPAYVRIGLRTVPECERLVLAFDDPDVQRVSGLARG